MEPSGQTAPAAEPSILFRAWRAHYRLSWAERLAPSAAFPRCFPGADQAVRYSSHLCCHARPSDGVTPPELPWVFSPRTGCSERNLRPCLPGSSLMLSSSAGFIFPSSASVSLSHDIVWSHGFRSPDQG